MSEIEITDSDSESSMGIQQAWQWMEVKISGQPHNTKHLSRAQEDNNEAVHTKKICLSRRLLEKWLASITLFMFKHHKTELE
jgi:hypothetical protein